MADVDRTIAGNRETEGRENGRKKERRCSRPRLVVEAVTLLGPWTMIALNGSHQWFYNVNIRKEKKKSQPGAARKASRLRTWKDGESGKSPEGDG